MKESYLQTDKNYEIDCQYSYNQTYKIIFPLSATTKGKDFINRRFTIENHEKKILMDFILVRKGRDFEYRIIIDDKHESKGRLKNREFYISPIQDRNFAQEFETSKIYCKVNLAYALPFALKDGHYHFSVHPHKKYDWQSLLKDSIENYLNNIQYSSLLFLETGNNRGNLVNLHQFFDNIDYQLPLTNYESDLVNVPAETSLIVSPAGNNRFDVQAKSEINITFTGGNHNYCMWNVTRHVLEDMMQSKSEAVINFYYDTSAIVAQQKGIEGLGLNFSKNLIYRSNLLKDLLQNNINKGHYHSAYLSYFSGYLAKKYTAMYSTYTINYKAEGFEKTITIPGKGHRKIEVNFNYL